MSETVTVWRCSTCGKWSHAKRRPSSHKRLIRGLVADGTGTPDLAGEERARQMGLRVVEVHPERSGTDYRPMAGEPHLSEPYEDWYEPAGATVVCGPFERWEARPHL